MRINWKETAGYLLIILASCFFGGSASLGKTLMRDGLSTVMLMQIRSVLTTTVLFPFLLAFGRRHIKVQKEAFPLFVALAVPGLALVNASYYYAVKTLTIALAVFIQFTSPALVFLYGFLSGKEKATPSKAAALVLSIAGTYLMVQLQSRSMDTVSWMGVLSAFVSTLSFAFYVILSHHLGKKYSAWTILFYGYGIAAVFWCFVQNPAETFQRLAESDLWSGAVLFTLLSTLIPFILFLSGLRRVTPTGAAISSTTETLFASLFAFVLLGETLSAGQVIGAVFILAAIFLLVYQKEKVPVVVSAD